MEEMKNDFRPNFFQCKELSPFWKNAMAYAKTDKAAAANVNATKAFPSTPGIKCSPEY